MSTFPELIPNFIHGEESPAAAGDTFDNVNPHDGSVICRVASSRAADVDRAVAAARAA